MKTRFALVGIILCGVIAMGIGLTADAPVADAAAAKNLKVLPKGMDKKAIKKVMKKISKSLDVECEHCHDMDDMAKDTDNKKAARAMMQMTAELNKKYFAKSEHKVSCMTCHNGKKEPAE